MLNSSPKLAELSTARLILEPLVPGHAVESFPYWQDERLYRYVPTDPPESVEALVTRYEKLAIRVSPNGADLWLNWFMRERKSNQLVGFLECTVFTHRTAQIAYFVFCDHQQQGFASEGCSAVIEELRSRFDVGRVQAYVDTRNLPSISLIQRLKFKRIEYIENADSFKGALSSEYLFSISLSEKIA